VTRCTEPEVAVLRKVVYSFDFLKCRNSHIWSHSTLNYLLMNYSSQPFATHSSLPTAIDKKKHMHGRHCADLAFRHTTSKSCANN
jgi:hypothetical protein